MAQLAITFQSRLCVDVIMIYEWLMSQGTNLTGKMLIAMPSIQDGNFDHSVVFLCAHSDQGAMGLVINKAAPLMFFSDLLDKVELDVKARDIAEETLRMPVRIGGPVEQFRGFVLHDSGYGSPDTTLKVGAHYGLTATVDVLRDIAMGKGPTSRLIALGYSGWAPGQLENEIQHNGWLHCDADADLLFTDDLEAKHGKAIAKLGVSPGMLSADFGHA
jgi:putative transcriptional regulator